MTDSGECRDCTPHLLAYIDILGFKDFVDESEKSGTSPDAIAGLHRAISQARQHSELFEQHQRAWHGTKLSMEIFSDLIVISLDDTADDAADIIHLLVGYVLLNLAVPEPTRDQMADLYSGHPACDDCRALRLFARGSIVRARHYSHDGIVFSPALIEGHQVEQSTANFPRVVVQPSARRITREPFEHAEWLSFRRDMLWRDFDGAYFVNYLNVMTGHDRRAERLSWVLSQHRDAIQEKIAEKGTDLRVAPKYWWLASYHNAFCRFAQRKHHVKEDFTIPNAALPGHDQLGVWAE